MPLIEDKTDRNRVSEWCDKTLTSLKRHLVDGVQLTQKERETIRVQVDTLQAMRRIMCGPTVEEVEQQKDKDKDKDKKEGTDGSK